jgi:hypothetical protein
MENNLERDVKEKEENFANLCAEMEKLELQFIDEATRFAGQWFSETARHYVAKNSDYTLSLGPKIADLKTAVNTLVSNSEEIIRTVLTGPNIWWHMKPDLHSSISQYELLGNQGGGHRFPDVIDRSLRYALGELGCVLEKFGYNVITSGVNSKLYPEFWFYTSEDPKTQTTPYYPHLIEWSTDMIETVQKYNDFYIQAIALLREIQDIRDNIKKQQVLNLWETAK